MAILNSQQLSRAKTLIFEKGRLLERKLYGYTFESGDKAACLKALLAYQNPDGGFGNGLEPDVLCPESIPIGAESALFVLDMLDTQAPNIIEPLLDWLEVNQLESGAIQYPPASLDQYPHQPWWEGSDRDRILAIAGRLSTWQSQRPGFFSNVRRFYEASGVDDNYSFYSYPTFVYLAHCQHSAEDKQRFEAMLGHLPAILAKNAEHFPLFSRYWYHLKPFVAQEVVDQAADSVAAAIRNDGGITQLYPDLPWWQPIFTLDSLMLLKRWGYL